MYTVLDRTLPTSMVWFVGALLVSACSGELDRAAGDASAHEMSGQDGSSGASVTDADARVLDSVGIDLPDVPSDTVSLDAQPLQGDLVALHVSGPAEVVVGQTVVIDWGVGNVGEEAVGAFDYLLVLSDDREIGPEDMGLCWSIAEGVPALEQRDGSLGCVIPETLTPGVYTLGLIIDPDDELSELDETNNNVAATASFQAIVAEGTNLQALWLSTGESTVEAGASLRFNWADSNTGSEFLEPYWFSLWLSSDEEITVGDLPVCSGVTESGLSALDVGEHAVDCPVPSDISGEWWAGLMLDHVGEIDEVNETDNVVWTESPIEVLLHGVDLAISDVASETSLFLGEPFVVSFRVTNEGGDPVERYTYDLILTLSGPSAFSSVVCSGEDNEPLEGLESRVVQHECTVVDLPPQRVFVSVRLDPFGLIDELDEFNNEGRSSEIADLSVASPDLVPTDMKLAGNWVVADGMLPIQVEVANVGSQDVTEAFNIGVMLSDDPTIGEGDRPFCTGYHEVGLGVGETLAMALECPTSVVEVGDYYVGLLLDRAGDISEADESNNIWSEFRRLTIGHSGPDADLSLESAWLLSSSGMAGAAFEGRCEIANWGDDGAGAFTIVAGLSPDGELDSVMPTSSVYVSTGVGPGGVANYELDGSIPMVPPGEYDLVFWVDSEGEVVELAEDNNVFWIGTPFTVVNDGE